MLLEMEKTSFDVIKKVILLILFLGALGGCFRPKKRFRDWHVEVPGA
jgi:hypothetical protein